MRPFLRQLMQALYFLNKVISNILKHSSTEYYKLMTCGHIFVCLLINRISNNAYTNIETSSIIKRFIGIPSEQNDSKTIIDCLTAFIFGKVAIGLLLQTLS